MNEILDYEKQDRRVKLGLEKNIALERNHSK